MVKPGYKTSEFWFTLVSFIFSGLFLLGVVGDNEQKEELIRNVSHGVESIILIGGQMLILWNYINSRKAAKQHAIKNATNITVDTPPITEIINDNNSKKSEHNTNNSTNKRRSNNNRSRKTNSKRKTKSQPSKKRSSS